MLIESRVSRLIHLIYEAAGDSAVWPVMLKTLAERMQARMTSFLEHRPGEQRDGVPFSYGLDSSFRASYESYYCLRNVYLERGKPALREGLVAPHEQYCSDVDLLGSEYYNDFQRKLNLYRVLVGVLSCRPDYLLIVTLSRSRHQPPFSREEMSVLEFLMPHLQRSWKLHSRLEKLISSREGCRPVAVPAVHTGPEWDDRQKLQLKFGLAGTEARFADLLIAGRSTAEICAELNIQISTGRTHLRHLFQKTNTTRQPALVCRLLQDAH